MKVEQREEAQATEAHAAMEYYQQHALQDVQQYGAGNGAVDMPVRTGSSKTQPLTVGSLTLPNIGQTQRRGAGSYGM